MAIKTRSLKLEHLGSKGELLCWAEVSHVVSRYYSRDPESFCAFVREILGCDPCSDGSCDEKWFVKRALYRKCIKTEAIDHYDFWEIVASNFKAESPLPWVIIVGDPNSKTKHATIISGHLKEGNVEGIVIQDPVDEDFLRLFLKESFDEKLGSVFSPFGTRPDFTPEPVRGRTEVTWGDDEIQEMRLPRVLPSQSHGSKEAFGALRSLLNISQESSDAPCGYELRLGPFLKESNFGSTAGFRFFLSCGDGTTVIADVIYVAASNLWRVACLSAGLSVYFRTRLLRDYLEGDQYEGGELRFQEWTDIGLAVALIKPSEVSGEIQQEEIALMGPRSYLGLGNAVPAAKRLAGLFMEELRTKLKQDIG